ncbi:psf1 domain containing protein [Grosmannia clavigera kw1407]|uniref:DNA replication complex GINS protein PSF1 n=1 Tax=Grosmannia clavigera (strain kw1407 / UAMH 11150) TaxID=655863 RepID=F0XIE5_GROCL|nr:psf1 domain containing protein [Grosmannia clavigera kw1407]EFX02559.1 psf1 domain containing protein [Grosmannia clavigera kw1407]
MYGDLGNKLVQHAKRTQNLAHLPPYQTEIVRAVTREVRDLDKDVAQLLEPFQGSFDPTTEPAKAYKLEELVWNGSDVVDLSEQQIRDGPSGARGSGGRAGSGGGAIGGGETGTGDGYSAGVSSSNGSSSLSPQEEDYVRQYSNLLAAYKGQWTDIDLTGSLEPPRDLFIDVRVLKDAGEIQTEYGSITLSRNSQFYVRQGDVERLIAQGYLQKLS